ncbi:MAG: CdaR family transcriptional regulator [Christensenellales bacterium]|jgi:carbohydrate diacid regulator
MELSKQLAEKIVREVNTVISQKINLMDKTGLIIASSDPMRIGTFHEGAYEIITQNLAELRINTDEEYSGAVRGLNYPIVLDGKVLGVLGITGESAEIESTARIIQRMTSLLLSEAYYMEQQLFGESIRNRYLDEWLYGEKKNITDAFIERGQLLNIDIQIPRRVLACCAYMVDGNRDERTIRLLETAESRIKQYISLEDRNNLFLKTATTLICLVTHETDEALLKFARSLQQQVETMHPELRLAVGIDDMVRSVGDMHLNCVRANRALAACMRTRKWTIRKYSDLNMEVFSDEVDKLTKMDYIRRVLRGYSDQEISEILAMLEVLYDNEGSIQKTADHLFIHKNTLQYKLKRIAETTGYDPRSIRHSSLYYIAIYFFREVRDLMQ